MAESVNGALSYTLADGLGSVSASVNSSRTVSATQLYDPYGAARYHSGTLPTDYAFTHQRADTTSGLKYYGARYYDPVAGQFSSADTVQAGGLNRYGYVSGNLETATDPSGHLLVNSGARNTSSALLSHQQQAAPVQAYVNQWAAPCDLGCTAGVIGQVVLGTDTLRQSYQTLVDPHASGWDKVKAGGVGLFTLGMDTVSIVSIFTGQPEGVEGARAAELALASAADLEHVGLVATDAAKVAGAANNETVDLYRAVGVREYNSVMKSGRFVPGANSLEARQFALSNGDALAYARTEPGKVAILKATLPTEALQYFDFSTDIDPTIFRQGVVTVQPGEQSAIFHKLLISINEVP